MTTLTQEEIAEVMAMADAERLRECQEVVAALDAVRETIERMKTSVFGGVQLWTGGIPKDLNDIAHQMTFLATSKVPMVSPGPVES
jgi:hypothetical protein